MLQGLFCKRNNNNNNNSNSNVSPPRRAALAHPCNNKIRAARVTRTGFSMRAVAVARLLCSAYVRVQTSTTARSSVERYVRASEHAVLRLQYSSLCSRVGRRRNTTTKPDGPSGLMTAAHVFIITPARRLRWRTGVLARQQCRQSLDARCSAYTVCGQRWRRCSGVRRRRRVKTPPVAASTARRRRSAPATSLCRNATAAATSLAVPLFSLRTARRLYGYTYYISHAAALVLVLVAPYPPPRWIVVRKPLHVLPTDTSGRPTRTDSQ